jgi:hypothetical protein
VNARIPRELDGIVGKALEKDRDLRYQHAADMRADLKRLKRDTDSGRSGPVAAPAPRSKLRQWLLGALRDPLAAGVSIWFRIPWTVSNFVSSCSAHAQADHVRWGRHYPALSPDGKFVAYVTGKASRGKG